MGSRSTVKQTVFIALYLLYPDGPEEVSEIGDDAGDPLEEPYRGGPFLVERYRYLANVDAGPLGADDEFGGEDIFADEALIEHRHERRLEERLDAVGVGSLEAEDDLEEKIQHESGEFALEGAFVLCPLHRLGADDHLRAVRLEDGERLFVELRQAEIYLVADDDIALGAADARLEGVAVVRFGVVEYRHAGEALREFLALGDGVVLGAVLGEYQFEVEIGAVLLQFGVEPGDRLFEYLFLVVDRNDYRNEFLVHRFSVVSGTGCRGRG